MPAQPIAVQTPAPAPFDLQLAPSQSYAPAPGTHQSAPMAAAVNQRFEFHITQQPGENAEALARRVAELVRRQGAADRRAALGDWS